VDVAIFWRLSQLFPHGQRTIRNGNQRPEASMISAARFGSVWEIQAQYPSHATLGKRTNVIKKIV
jgi:hypothetical protein